MIPFKPQKNHWKPMKSITSLLVGFFARYHSHYRNERIYYIIISSQYNLCCSHIAPFCWSCGMIVSTMACNLYAIRSHTVWSCWVIGSKGLFWWRVFNWCSLFHFISIFAGSASTRNSWLDKVSLVYNSQPCISFSDNSNSIREAVPWLSTLSRQQQH